MNSPVISIILPVFNVEQYLPKCLRSIADQTFKYFELIIINDCSPDSCSSIISDFVKANSHLTIKVVTHDKNKGISEARNSGIQIAETKYLYFLDSDDDIMPDCLEQLFTAAKTNNWPDIIVGENHIIDSDRCEEVRVKLSEGMYLQSQILETFCKRQWYNQVWNKLYKREFVDKHKLRFVEGKILEDELWSFQVATLARSLVIKKGLFYNYYIRPKSIISSVSGNLRRWNAFYEINKLISNFITSNKLHKNIFVQRYFLENLLVTLGGYAQNGVVTYKIFYNVYKLNVSSISNLKTAGLISRNESIAYRYFNLPMPLAFFYYKLTKLILSNRNQ